MKKGLLITLFSTAFTIVCSAQCGKEYEHICKSELEDDHFTPLTIKTLDNHEGDIDHIEYAYQFTKGKTYEFYFDGEMEEEQEINANLYNTHHDLVLKNDQTNHKIKFDCKKSGIYYIVFTFKDDEYYCGNVGLGIVSN